MQGLLPIAGVAVAALATAVGLVAAVDVPAPERTIDISHALHAKFDVDCVTCHVGVETGASAGVPSIEICGGCHDDPADSISRSANGKRVLDLVARKEEPVWTKLYALPDHVVFSHRRHVGIAKIACDACHGDIGASTTLPNSPVEATLAMDGCLACHERSGASRDCFACHR